MDEAQGVARLEAATGASFGQIASARGETERRLGERREQLASIEIDAGATVVLMGSWGRREVTSESDDDFMVLFEGAERADGYPTVEEIARVFGGPAPGREEIFGSQVWLDDLRSRIGRDEDTNTNLTRRLLFVLESVPVSGEQAYARARRELLAGYLDANVKDYRPPQFLLNDVIRYWRTIAVDFESKMRARKGEGWGLRNAKLRLSRKALFAGGLLPVLECYRYPIDGVLDYLDDRMSVPPLDRIADAFVDHDQLDAGIRALSAYDAFLAILDDHEQRQSLRDLGVDEARQSAASPASLNSAKSSRPVCSHCSSTILSCAAGYANTSCSDPHGMRLFRSRRTSSLVAVFEARMGDVGVPDDEAERRRRCVACPRLVARTGSIRKARSIRKAVPTRWSGSRHGPTRRSARDAVDLASLLQH